MKKIMFILSVALLSACASTPQGTNNTDLDLPGFMINDCRVHLQQKYGDDPKSVICGTGIRKIINDMNAAKKSADTLAREDVAATLGEKIKSELKKANQTVMDGNGDGNAVDAGSVETQAVKSLVDEVITMGLVRERYISKDKQIYSLVSINLTDFKEQAAKFQKLGKERRDYLLERSEAIFDSLDKAE